MTRTFKHFFPLMILFCLLCFGCVQNQSTGLLDESTTAGSVRSGLSVKTVHRMIEDEDDLTLIDTRSVDEYAVSHLPTALSMPICGVKNFIDRLPEDKDQALVFYCGWSGCVMSARALDAAAQAGYGNIEVMLEGVAGWTEAGYPTFADDTFIRTGNPVLIDLRASRKDTVQRIPGSVSIPFDILEEIVDDIPKKAPIVVYSDTIRESHAALSEFRAAGFTKVAMVDGNFQGWKQRGNPLTSGPITTTVNWTQKTAKDEVSVTRFKKALKGGMNALILDVRTNEEAAIGKLKNSIHIPLDELADREDELPKNKKILVHCTHGARANMAADRLRQHGFSSFFLNATVECKGNDCEIGNE